MPPNHRLAQHVAVPSEELYREPFIGRVVGSGSRMVYERELAAQGVAISRIHTVLEVDSAVAAVNAVEAGLGVALVSIYAAEKSLQLAMVTARRILGVSLLRPFYLLTMQRYSSRAVTETAAFLRSSEARQAAEGRRTMWPRLD